MVNISCTLSFEYILYSKFSLLNKLCNCKFYQTTAHDSVTYFNNLIHIEDSYNFYPIIRMMSTQCNIFNLSNAQPTERSPTREYFIKYYLCTTKYNIMAEKKTHNSRVQKIHKVSTSLVCM